MNPHLLINFPLRLTFQLSQMIALAVSHGEILAFISLHFQCQRLPVQLFVSKTSKSDRKVCLYCFYTVMPVVSHAHRHLSILLHEAITKQRFHICALQDRLFFYFNQTPALI